MLPLFFYALNPSVRLALDVDIDHVLPFLARRGEVDEHDQTSFLGVYGFGKLAYDPLESMHLERRAHDQQQVGFAEEVEHLEVANLLAERVVLVVQDDRRSEGADGQRPRSSLHSPRACSSACVVTCSA